MQRQKRAKLKVSESYTRDTGRMVARIDSKSMDNLDLKTGDVILVENTRNSILAKALPLYPADENKKMIRMDKIMRDSLDIEPEVLVTIQKVICEIAEVIHVSPLEAIPPIDTKFLADALEYVPLKVGQKFAIPYYGSRLYFQVSETFPKLWVQVDARKTEFKIGEKYVTIPKELKDQLLRMVSLFLEAKSQMIKELSKKELDESKIFKQHEKVRRWTNIMVMTIKDFKIAKNIDLSVETVIGQITKEILKDLRTKKNKQKK